MRLLDSQYISLTVAEMSAYQVTSDLGWQAGNNKSANENSRARCKRPRGRSAAGRWSSTGEMAENHG
jgi:hypothetical protein